MKKNVFEMVVAMVNGQPVADMDTLRNEINAEYERMNAKREGNKAIYAAAEKILLDALTDTPQTSREIFDANTWPKDFTIGKLNYALRAMWADKVVKHDNGKSAFTYTRKNPA